MCLHHSAAENQKNSLRSARAAPSKCTSARVTMLLFRLSLTKSIGLETSPVWMCQWNASKGSCARTFLLSFSSASQNSWNCFGPATISSWSGVQRSWGLQGEHERSRKGSCLVLLQALKANDAECRSGSDICWWYEDCNQQQVLESTSGVPATPDADFRQMPSNETCWRLSEKSIF